MAAAALVLQPPALRGGHQSVLAFADRDQPWRPALLRGPALVGGQEIGDRGPRSVQRGQPQIGHDMAGGAIRRAAIERIQDLLAAGQQPSLPFPAAVFGHQRGGGLVPARVQRMENASTVSSQAALVSRCSSSIACSLPGSGVAIIRSGRWPAASDQRSSAGSAPRPARSIYAAGAVRAPRSLSRPPRRGLPHPAPPTAARGHPLAAAAPAGRQRRKADDLHHGVVLLRPDRAGRPIRFAQAQRRQRRRRRAPGPARSARTPAASGRRRAARTEPHRRPRTSGADVRQRSSTSTPRSQAMPASRASTSLGVRPTPSTIASATIEEPSASSATGRPSADPPTARRPAFSRSATPLAACSVARCADTPGCTLRAHSRASRSSTVTLLPDWRAVAATSNPIQPPPTISTCRSGPSRARSRSASARAQHMHAVMVHARQRRHRGPAAGAEDQLVVGQRPPVRRIDPLVRQAQPQRRDAGLELDAHRLQLARGEQLGAFRQSLAGQHRLAQRRPFVGRVRLVAQQHDAAVVAAVAQRGGGPAARLAGADDDDGAGVHAASAFR